jgi:hypothetical protein
MFFAPLLVDMTRTEEETRRFVRNVPEPPKGYEFSRRQREEQYHFFYKRTENSVFPSNYSDLYNYVVVAVRK